MEILGNVADLDHYCHAPNILHLQRTSTADEDIASKSLRLRSRQRRPWQGSSAYLTREGLILGTGIGLRYITPIGPLRLDAGVPIDRRSDVDDMLQIYVSIGQAY